MEMNSRETKTRLEIWPKKILMNHCNVNIKLIQMQLHTTNLFYQFYTQQQ